ncbi:phage portal protein [Planctomicrobium sp. SH661]|uniref:phage portal protein n=1 Tax=Planctomicrobium sp. SH661 TaxID=3448124 RepID=UPI003F5C76A0
MNHTEFAERIGSGLIAPGIQNAVDMNPGTWSSPSVEFMDGLGGREAMSGVRVNSRTSLGYPAFFRGVKLIADTVAKLPLIVHQLEEDGGMPKAKDHPAYRLLKRKPNRFITSKTFRRAMTLHAQMHGNGYAFIQRDGRGNPLDLTILDPVCTFPIKWIPSDTNIPEVHYSTVVDGEMMTFLESDILHIRNLCMDGLIGIPVLDVMREAIGMGIAVRQFGSHFFGQGANISGVLMVPKTIQPNAQKNLLDYWKKTTSGMANSHKVALVSGGATFTKMSFSPDEAQFLETKRFEIIEIANIVGVPPHKLGDNSRQAYNSIEAENRSALDESYDPWLGTWEEECEAKLLTEEQQEEESHVIRFDRSKMLLPTLNERASANRVFCEIGVNTVNDVLRSEGRETIGPEGDVRYVPANWMPLGSASASSNEMLNLLRRIESHVLNEKRD